MVELTQKYVSSLFSYRDGKLFWKRSRAKNCVKGGDEAGSPQPRGYIQVRIDYKRYYIHQIIFLMYNGYLPKQIDHIDRDKTNNKIENLREATSRQNQWNSKPQEKCVSKYKGVDWRKPNNKWQSRIMINGKRKYLGYFTSEIEAAKAYNEAAIKYYGEYACLNMIDDRVSNGL